MQLYIDEVGNNDVNKWNFFGLNYAIVRFNEVGNNDVNRWNVLGLNYVIVR